MPAAAAPAVAAAAAEPVEEVRQPSRCIHPPEVKQLTRNFQEKPKEKTIFNVKLESFEATSKSKVIKEVKAMVPNLTLIEVRPTSNACACQKSSHYFRCLGEEVRRVVTEGS